MNMTEENNLMTTNGVIFKVTQFIRNIFTIPKRNEKTEEELIKEITFMSNEEKDRLQTLLSDIINEEIDTKDVDINDIAKLEILLDREIAVFEEKIEQDKNEIKSLTTEIKKVKCVS